METESRPELGDTVTTWNAGDQPTQFFGYGSWHADVFNVAMADNAAKSIAKNIDARVFESLVTRSGGERVGDDF